MIVTTSQQSRDATTLGGDPGRSPVLPAIPGGSFPSKGSPFHRAIAGNITHPQLAGGRALLSRVHPELFDEPAPPSALLNSYPYLTRKPVVVTLLSLESLSSSARALVQVILWI